MASWAMPRRCAFHRSTTGCWQGDGAFETIRVYNGVPFADAISTASNGRRAVSTDPPSLTDSERTPTPSSPPTRSSMAAGVTITGGPALLGSSAQPVPGR